jgi:hypothetical protein
VSPVRYELVLYIPEDDILHSHRRENLKYRIILTAPFTFYKTQSSLCIVSCIMN